MSDKDYSIMLQAQRKAGRARIELPYPDSHQAGAARAQAGPLYLVRGRPLLRDCYCARRSLRCPRTGQPLERNPRCGCRLHPLERTVHGITGGGLCGG